MIAFLEQLKRHENIRICIFMNFLQNNKTWTVPKKTQNLGREKKTQYYVKQRLKWFY